jgi:hypothetical protein
LTKEFSQLSFSYEYHWTNHYSPRWSFSWWSSPMC